MKKGLSNLGCNSYMGLFNELLLGEHKIIKRPWNPEIGDTYYYPYFSDSLYQSAIWEEKRIDLARKRNVDVYRTSDGAISKAKELGWT